MKRGRSTLCTDSFAFDSEEQIPDLVKVEPDSKMNIKTEPMDNEDVTMKADEPKIKHEIRNESSERDTPHNVDAGGETNEKSRKR